MEPGRKRVVEKRNDMTATTLTPQTATIRGDTG
jgi:hypothetical protein